MTALAYQIEFVLNNLQVFPKRFLLFLLLVSSSMFGGEVDTVSTYSASMGKDIKAVVVKPEAYNDSQKIPVVYLLHGYSGNYKDWVTNFPAIKEYADEHNLLIVCPDGNYSSWYLDSPEKPEVKFETYISSELVEWVDEHYNTIAEKSGRAITGLSMGGHGALYLAFKHQDVYSVAGSMSGGVDLRPFPNKWEISGLLGSYAENPHRWDNNSVINLTHLLTPDALAIILECGTDDFFYDVNVKLHEKLMYQNIPHTFISSPGGHTWEFWTNAIKYQLEFISNQFESQNGV